MKKKLIILAAVVFFANSDAVLAIDPNVMDNEIKEVKEVKEIKKEFRRGEIKRDRQIGLQERELRQGEKVDFEARKAEMEDKKKEMLEKKCAMIQERMIERNTNFENKKEKHMAVYRNMVNRILKFIEKFSAQGYDVSKIKADLDVLNEKIQKFSDDYGAQVSKMNEAKNSACGNSEGNIKKNMINVRSMMESVRSDAMDIRKYMLETVRPDIQALRKQKIKAKATVETAAPQQPIAE